MLENLQSLNLEITYRIASIQARAKALAVDCQVATERSGVHNIMAEQKLDVIVKAIKLMEYSMTVTSNRKRYPIKYIQLIKRIQNKSMDIYEFLLEANRLNVVSSKIERLGLQTKAITSCDKLSCYIELSMNLNIIGSNMVENWQKQIDDIKYMTIAWREKDKKR